MHNKSHKDPGRFVQAAFALFVLFSVNQSYAACEQIDLKGTWFLNGISGDTQFLEFSETDWCKVKLGSAGKVKDGSQCKFRDDEGVGLVPLQGGNLKLNSSCRITGTLTVCEGEFCETVSIDDARLDSGKTVITMVGRSTSDPTGVFFLTGVKK